MSEDPWPFDQPRNCATISLRSVVFEGAPVLHVSHDDDDHGWQFLGGGEFTEADACVIALHEAVALDPSVLELADLPPGWRAWRRSRSAPWKRSPIPREPDESG